MRENLVQQSLRSQNGNMGMLDHEGSQASRNFEDLKKLAFFQCLINRSPAHYERRNLFDGHMEDILPANYWLT